MNLLSSASPAPLLPAPSRRSVRCLAAAVAALAAAAAGAVSPPAGPIINFSARAAAGQDAQTLILGFTVAGGSAPVLLRGVGPALRTFGVSSALSDPQITLYQGGRFVARNDNWGSEAAAPETGAFPLPVDSLDAAMLRTLDIGGYTFHVGANGASTGVALGEIYAVPGNSSGRLINVSARALAGSGESTFIAGFTIGGTSRRTVLLRALGPALTGLGVSGALADPRLALFDHNGGSPFATNDDWGGAPALQTAFRQSGAFGLAADSRDAAMLVTLAPGCYTAQVSGPTNAPGVALVELYDDPIKQYPRTSANNVVYRHGDFLEYDASGEYVHADGSKTVLTGGWLRLEIFDEGVTNPLNGNLPVMSLVETQLYVGAFVGANGSSTPVRVIGYPTTRYYVQDAYGTILYQGEKVPEGFDAAGAPINNTYWFSSPLDYIQYAAPYVVGATKVTPYTKRAAVGSAQKLGNTWTQVETTEPVTVPLGTFDTFRLRLLETSRDPASDGTPLWSRTQNISPDLGIVKFDFFSVTPGDTGAFVMSLADTNLPYLGGNNYSLAQGNRLAHVAPGQFTRFTRTGMYIDDDGTIEEIGGWFTMEVRDDATINPRTNHRVLTLLETHHTEIEATDLAGHVTRTTQDQAFRRYCEITAEGETSFVGDTGPDGSPVWFDTAFVPLPFPYAIGEAKSETVTASSWTSGQAVPAYSYTPSMKVIGITPVRTTLGTFECYRMTYEDTNGYRAEQYSYPLVGVVRFTYPAPAGKSGHMDLTLSSTNIPF